MKNKLFKDTALYAVGEIFPRVISFILLPIFTTYLTTEDYGILSYTSAFVMFLYVFSSLSLNSFVLRNYFELKTDEERKLLIGNVFLFIACFNVLILSLIYLLLPKLIEFYSIKIPWDPYFRLAVISNFLEVFTIIPLVLYRVKQEALNFVVLSVFRVIFQFSLVYYFVVHLNMGVIGSYYGQLIPLIVFFFLSWAIIYKHAIFNFNFNQIKLGLKFSLPLLPGAVAYLIMSLSDRIILERHISLMVLGVYNVAVTFSQALNVVIQSGYRALEPEIYKRFNQDNFKGFINQISGYFLSFVYILGIGLALFANEVFWFLTSSAFHWGSELVPFIIFGVLFAAHNVIFSSVLIAEKNTKSIGISTVIGGFVSIVVNIFMIPYWGVYASAFASALAFFIMDTFLYFQIKTPISLRNSIICFLLYGIVVLLLLIWKPEVVLFNFLIKVIILILLIIVVLVINKIDVRKIKILKNR